MSIQIDKFLSKMNIFNVGEKCGTVAANEEFRRGADPSTVCDPRQKPSATEPRFAAFPSAGDVSPNRLHPRNPVDTGPVPPRSRERTCPRRHAPALRAAVSLS